MKFLVWSRHNNEIFSFANFIRSFLETASKLFSYCRKGKKFSSDASRAFPNKSLRKLCSSYRISENFLLSVLFLNFSTLFRPWKLQIPEGGIMKK